MRFTIPVRLNKQALANITTDQFLDSVLGKLPAAYRDQAEQMRGVLFSTAQKVLGKARAERGLKPILIIQCGSKKASTTVPINQLYTKGLWNQYRTALTELGSPSKHPNLDVYVLSAQLGLLAENKAACPYNLVMVKDNYRKTKKGDTPVRKESDLIAWMEKNPEQQRLLQTWAGRTIYFTGQAKGGPYFNALERLGKVYGFTAEALPEYTERMKSGARGGIGQHLGSLKDFLQRMGTAQTDQVLAAPTWTAPNLTQAPTAIEVFSGGGLFSLAAEIEGMDVRIHCEIDNHAVKTARHNLDPNAVECDITKFRPKPGEYGLDIFMGGPPCQPWSRARAVQGGAVGADDPRNLWMETTRLIEDLHPRVVMLENVKGILAKKHRETLGRPGEAKKYPLGWWADAESLGYEGVIWDINAASYGTPQNRERVWFVLWPKGAPWGETLRKAPPATHYDPRKKPVPGLLPWVPAKDRFAEGCCQGYGLTTCLNLGNFRGRCNTCINGSNFEIAPNEDRGGAKLTEGQRASYFAKLKKKGKVSERRRIQAHPPTDVGGRIYKPPSELGRKIVGQYLVPAVTKHMQKGVGPSRVATMEQSMQIDLSCPVDVDAVLLRELTVREAAKAQDVPQWYEFKGPRGAQYAQIGNGIAVNMGRAVVRHALDALGYGMLGEDTIAAKQKRRHQEGLWPYGDQVEMCIDVADISEGFYDLTAGYFTGPLDLKGKEEARILTPGGDPDRERRVAQELVEALDDFGRDPDAVHPGWTDGFMIDEAPYLTAEEIADSIHRYTDYAYGLPAEDDLLKALEASTYWQPKPPGGYQWEIVGYEYPDAPAIAATIPPYDFGEDEDSDEDEDELKPAPKPAAAPSLFAAPEKKEKEGFLFEEYGEKGAPKPGEKGFRAAPKPSNPNAWGGQDPYALATELIRTAQVYVNEPETLWAYQAAHPDIYSEASSEDLEDTLPDLLGVPGLGGDGKPLSEDDRDLIAIEAMDLAMEADPERFSGMAGNVIGERKSRRGSPPVPIPTKRVDGREIPVWAADAILGDKLASVTPGYSLKTRLVNVSKEEAEAFIKKHHSALPYLNPKGLMYALGLKKGNRLVAVATAGSPTGKWKRIDPHRIVELTRVASDGSTANAASQLVARLIKIVKSGDANRGDPRLPGFFVTYQLGSEKGTTYAALKDLGLRPVAYRPGQKAGGARAKAGPESLADVDKIRWECCATPPAAPANWEVLDPKYQAREKIKATREAGQTVKPQIGMFGAASRPEPKTKVLSFSSGANEAGQIRGLVDIGKSPGVAVKTLNSKTGKWSTSCREGCVRELIRATHNGIPIFMDSGAFSEMDLSVSPPVPKAPITPEDWRERLEIYAEVINSTPPDKRHLINVVAPDMVGSQEGTLERLKKYKKQIDLILDTGVRVLVPMQPGPDSAGSFYRKVLRILGRSDFVPSIPMPAWRKIYGENKAGAQKRGELLRDFLRETRPERVHLLGFSPRSRDVKEIAKGIRDSKVEAQFQADATTWIGGKLGVGRGKGRKGADKPTTIAQDILRTSLQARNWPDTAENIWRDVEGGAMDLRKAYSMPSLWMTTEDIEFIAQYDDIEAEEDIDPHRYPHNGPLAPEVQTAILTSVDTAMLRNVEKKDGTWVFAEGGGWNKEKGTPLIEVLWEALLTSWEKLDAALTLAQQTKREAIDVVFGDDEGVRPVEGQQVFRINKR